jgi:hypothetical protein
MKKQPRNIFSYLSDQFLGSFTGFVIGIWASSLVSHFFATRSIKNLWGLTSRKTVVDKQTFTMMEWLASAIVGYVVFEVVLRIMKDQLLPRVAIIRFRFLRLMIRTGWHIRLRNLASRDESVVQELP